MKQECKVVGCNNYEFDCQEGKLYGYYGYCQKHVLDLLRLKHMMIEEEITE